MKKNIILNNKLLLVLILILSFSFFVQKAEAQCTLFCLDTVRVSLSAENCSREITTDLLLYAPNQCTYPKKVELFDTSGTILPSSPIVDKASYGKIVVAKVTELKANNSCTSIISVLDNTPPIITCKDITVDSNADLSPDVIGKPSITDNCSSQINLEYADSYQNYSCSSPFATQITRYWTAIDEFKNKSNCNQLIKLKWLSLNDVVFPNNYDGFEQPLVSCDADTSILKLGMPLVGGMPITNNISLTPYYQDQYIPLCGGGFRLLRLWNVVNNCTNEFKNDVQLIECRDVQPPKLTCPAPITISTNEESCSASFDIINPSVTDNCSKWFLDITSEKGRLNTEMTKITELPIGDFYIKFYAKDECENVDSCFQKITVTDLTSPVLVTKIDYTIYLDSLGSGTLKIANINEGTYDNCGVIKDIVIRRLATGTKAASNWSSELTFDCDDIISQNNIEILATDDNGNSSNRIIPIFVKDNYSPQITCPANITVTCDKLQELNNLAGNPIVKDNCTYSLSFEDLNKTGGCGIGTIERKWIVKDNSPRIATCTQYVYVTNSKNLYINLNNLSDPNDDVDWPSNISVEGCTNNILPKETGEPIIHYPHLYCGAITSSFEDQIFPASGFNCYRIQRKWTVIDRCVYQNSNYTKGKWEYIQEILVANKTAPQFSRCYDTTYNVSVANCGPAVIKIKGYATDDCTPSGLLQWTCHVDRNNDGSIDVTGKSSSLTAGFSTGKHRIIWEVLDGCDNVATCEFVITVRDGSKPKALCKPEIVAQLEAAGSSVVAYITPEMLDNQSTDNCTPNNQLTKFIAKSKFDCNDIGSQLVILHVSDTAGNEDTCSTTVIIKDDNKWCIKNARTEISGVIKTEAGDPVTNVTVGLTNMPNLVTDNSGSYLFNNLVQGNSYTITPQKSMNIKNGVTTHDLVLMNKHILGLELLNSPYKIIAADVNNDGKVSTSDMIELRKVILGYNDYFPNNDSWRFINQNTIFNDPSKPLLQTLNGFVNIPSISGVNNIDFIGIKVGDLSGNASPSNLQEALERNQFESKTLNLVYTPQNNEAAQSIDIEADDNISGAQFCLEYDDLNVEIESILPIAAGMNQSNFNINNKGKILVSWNGLIKTNDNKLFTIQYRLRNGNINRPSFTLNETILKSEYIDLENNVFPIELNSNKTVNQEFAMDQNVPNPFKQNTSIKINVPEDCDGKLIIMGINGKIVKELKRNLEKGTTNWTVENLDIESGVWLYKLETKFGSIVKKMVVLN